MNASSEVSVNGLNSSESISWADEKTNNKHIHIIIKNNMINDDASVIEPIH